MNKFIRGNRLGVGSSRKHEKTDLGKLLFRFI